MFRELMSQPSRTERGDFTWWKCLCGEFSSLTNVIWIDHWYQFVHGDINIRSVVVAAQEDSGSLRNGSVPIGLLGSGPASPLQLTTVGLDGCGQCGSIVAAPTDEHDTQLGHIANGADFQRVNLRLDLQKRGNQIIKSCDQSSLPQKLVLLITGGILLTNICIRETPSGIIIPRSSHLELRAVGGNWRLW